MGLLCLLCINLTLAERAVANSDDQTVSNRLEIARQVNAELIKATQGGKHELWKLFALPIPKSLEGPIPNETKDVYEGRSLPSFYLGPRPPGYDTSDILGGKKFGATEDEQRFSRRSLWVIPSLAERESVELFRWMESRSKQLPPNSADLVLGVALQSAFYEVSEKFWNVTREDWRRMLRAKNPVYRLLAMERLPYFETNSLRKVEACDAALRETNTIFQYWALQDLEPVGGPASVKLIEDFLKRTPATNDGTIWGDTDIVEVAHETLAKCRSKP